ncbi:MAG TPA: isoprenylcysteine carboxylmethyltransferase family protein [Sedimentisphaerales bacterium]|nr:isoprenylcysteine carboxylmethyltransferase family protein [Sedimentisphaerales bacterium]
MARRVLYFLAACIVFLVIFPVVYLFVAGFLNRWVSIPCTRPVELILAGISGAVGLLIALWAAWTQWTVGRGGPTPLAPTQKLITNGPYAYCRNPMHLGTILYLFAFGTFLANLTVGLICCLFEIMAVTGGVKGIEEKELALRFGRDYLEYKQNTPFLIPRIGRSRASHR